MKSFDFYDTLVTRLVGDPADIFSLVGERLGIPEFRAMRIAAETKAREALGGEVTYADIYDHLSLPSQLKEKARLLELEFERSLVAPVTAIASQFQMGDLIVSDMYHDEHHYRGVLEQFIPGVVPGAVLISGATGVNKSGGGLWKKVTTDYPELRSHIGDNLFSDVRQARRSGLIAEHFAQAALNTYEMALAKQGGDASLIAGASRATRLSLIRSDSSPADRASIESFASVIGPLLHSFVHWIMRSCEKAGIHDVYFLARDGQLPFRICSRLVAESGQELRCHYIYASRQALHLPGCKTVDDAESWLLEGTPQLTLRTIAERAGLTLDVVMGAAAQRITVGPDDDIPLRERQFLAEVIRSPLFADAFTASIRRAFEPANAYYLQEGFAARRDVALVDVGWNGRLQRSLGTLLDKSGLRPTRMLGLYLCLSRRLSQAQGDDLRGFVAAPEHPELVAFFDQYRHVFEAALSADHPTTTGFEFSHGVARPLFGEAYPPETRQKIALQHATVDAFLENIVALGRAAGRPVVPSSGVAVENFRRFLSRPTRGDGLSFEGFLFVDGQTGSEMKPVARSLRLTDWLRPSSDLGYWTEGTLSASGLSQLGIFTRLRRATGRLLAKIK
ncbi:hypothetical protein [Acidicapsa ligni]|uniref:hypothetical protein n=1 Tax=Acidicapsa ligni TaxID=542300 RepID=UPI0021E049CF|nr:hypothetical protein [Acidicapsa ligni]